MWLNDPQNHTGGSVATGRASYAGQVKGDDQNKRDTLVSYRLGVGRVAENSIPKNIFC